MLARLHHYRFDWKLSLLTALLLPLLLALGNWQLAREQEKLDLQRLYAERLREQPQALRWPEAGTDLQYMRVEVEGSYDQEHLFLLDNRIQAGQPGYEVLQPFNTTAGDTLLVNRGWIAQGDYREVLPTVPVAAAGQQSLRGSLYAPLGEAFVLGPELATAEWPRVVQVLDIASLGNMAGYEHGRVYPYSLRLEAEGRETLVRNWPVVNTGPEKHRAYAVQWFAMALALVLLYLFHSTRPTQGNEDEKG